MVLVKLLIDLMAFNIPTSESIITDYNILCNKKKLHSKMVKPIRYTGRVTITFFHVVSASQVTVQTLAGRLL